MSDWNRNLNISLNKGIYSVTCPLLRNPSFPKEIRFLLISEMRRVVRLPRATYIAFSPTRLPVYSYFHTFGQGRHHWLPAAAPPEQITSRIDSLKPYTTRACLAREEA